MYPGQGVQHATDSVVKPSVETRSTASQSLTIGVSPSRQSPISFKTFPGALCTVADSTWTFPADVNGDALIYVAPTEKFTSIQDAITCVRDGQVENITLTLSSSVEPPRSLPVASSGPPIAPSSATIAQYVSTYGFDPRTAPDAVLAANNLPPRPDNLASHPEDNIGWLRAVFSPTTKVITSGVDIPNVSLGFPEAGTGGGRISPAGTAGGYGNSSTNNWSGVAANGVQGTYNTIRGYWNDPNSYTSNTPAYSSLWVGIDGCSFTCGADGTNIYQDGTETDRLTKPVVQYTNTFIWYESYPYDPDQKYFTATSPGDEIYCTVYKAIGTQVNVNYYCKDITEGNAVFATEVTGPNFIGDSAEWIMERTNVTSVGTYYFTDYKTAAMSQASVVSGTTSLNYDQIPEVSGYNLYNITMIRSGDTLSTASELGSGNLSWTWHADH
jgi:hypothetical protein